MADISMMRPIRTRTDLSAAERSDMDAPTWVLVWRKFKRHKLGLISGIFLLFSYLMLPIAGFIAPYTPNERSADYLYAPPQGIHLFHEGEFIGPFVYPTEATADLVNYRWTYETDTTRPMPLCCFSATAANTICLGSSRRARHLFCAPEGATIFLLGSDRLGRDVFSPHPVRRAIVADRGLIGITVSFLYWGSPLAPSPAISAGVPIGSSTA